MRRMVRSEDEITSIIKLAQEIGWLKNLDDANRTVLYRELGELHQSGLHFLQQELESRLRGSENKQ
jgi:hypothetical protein